MQLIIGILSLLLAAPSFEGKWTAEVPGPGGGNATMLFDIKTDGTAEMSATDKDGKTLAKEPGKWKKTGDKTIELTIDKDPTKAGKGELLDENTLEVTSPDGKKLKLTRSK
jgi:hypothetical protein